LQLLKVDERPIAEGRGNQVGSKRKASENIAAEPAPIVSPSPSKNGIHEARECELVAAISSQTL